VKYCFAINLRFISQGKLFSSSNYNAFAFVTTHFSDDPEICESCNQHCFFCYNVWRDQNERLIPLSKQKRIEIIERIVELEIFGLIISGGEPLTVNYLEELIKIANNANIETTIITNGLLLSYKRCETLKNVGLKGIQISLHSCEEREHDEITGIKGSFHYNTEQE